jgi:hypothetical protein
MKDAYDFICMKVSIYSVVIIDKTFKMPIVKTFGYNTNYIDVLISVICLDGTIHVYIDGMVLLFWLPYGVSIRQAQ